MRRPPWPSPVTAPRLTGSVRFVPSERSIRRVARGLAVATATVLAGSAAVVSPAGARPGAADPSPASTTPAPIPSTVPPSVGPPTGPSSPPATTAPADDPLGPHAVPSGPAGTSPATPGPVGGSPPRGAAPPGPAATIDLGTVRRLDASLDLASAQQRLALADAALSAAVRRRDVVAEAHRSAVAEVALRRARIRAYAVRIYKGGDDFGDLAVMAGARSLTDLARRRSLLAAADESEVRRLREAVEAEEIAAAFLEAAEADRAGVDAARRAFEARRDAARARVAGGGRLDGWDDGPLILGPSRLTAEDLAGWFRSRGRRENTTVPIEDLARLYIEEGHDEGVRGDIAFAQSILETGGFHFSPGGTVLTAADNNFGGIGACDSCARGWSFPSARLGVRQQVQLLRTYADPHLTSADLAHPPVRSRPERHGVRGCCRTWLDLNGVWATGAGYGERILQIYSDLARYALTRR